MFAYSDIGKNAKDMLYGGGKTGVFQFNHQLCVTSTTADGLTLTAKALNKGDKVDVQIKGAIKHKDLIADVIVQGNRVNGSVTLPPMAPGLKMQLLGSFPDLQSAKLSVDYAQAGVNVKTVIGLNSSPKMDVFAASTYHRLVVGAEGGFDVTKNTLNRWGVALGYNGIGYSGSAALANSGQLMKASYYVDVTPKSGMAAEVMKPVEGSDTSPTMSLAYTRELDTGARVKAKVDSSGIVSALWEQKLDTAAKLSMSMQMNAVNVSDPKMGISLDL